MSKVRHISFEELAGNLAELLTSVREERTSIVVEYGSGEKVLIKPYAPARRGARKKLGEVAGRPEARTAEESAGSEPPNRRADRENVNKENINKENVSSVGAVYDIDPDSITPG